MSFLLHQGYEIPVGSHAGKAIVIGSDHRGYEHKQRLAEYLLEQGNVVEDLGTYSKVRCDYPPFSGKLGRRVGASQDRIVGIGICGSGIGIIIPASKYPRVYAARCLTVEDATVSRQHNNTNLLGLAADHTSLEDAITIVEAWMNTSFCPEPHKDEVYLRRFFQTLEIERELFR